MPPGGAGGRGGTLIKRQNHKIKSIRSFVKFNKNAFLASVDLETPQN